VKGLLQACATMSARRSLARECTPLMRFVPLGVYTEDPSDTTDIEYFPALTEPLG